MFRFIGDMFVTVPNHLHLYIIERCQQRREVNRVRGWTNNKKSDRENDSMIEVRGELGRAGLYVKVGCEDQFQVIVCNKPVREHLFDGILIETQTISCPGGHLIENWTGHWDQSKADRFIMIRCMHVPVVELVGWIKKEELLQIAERNKQRINGRRAVHCSNMHSMNTWHLVDQPELSL